jgi:hypothetical protein
MFDTGRIQRDDGRWMMRRQRRLALITVWNKELISSKAEQRHGYVSAVSCYLVQYAGFSS